MKITAIETVRIEEFPNLLWVQVSTDDGLVGLGETFFGPGAVEAHIHETIAPILLGQDPRLIGRYHSKLIGYVGFAGSSAEQRGRSAIDIALWDIWGKATNQPIHQSINFRFLIFGPWCLGLGRFFFFRLAYGGATGVPERCS